MEKRLRLIGTSGGWRGEAAIEDESNIKSFSSVHLEESGKGDWMAEHGLGKSNYLAVKTPGGSLCDLLYVSVDQFAR